MNAVVILKRDVVAPPVLCSQQTTIFVEWLEASKGQATLGKRWMRLRVENMDGRRISRRTSLLRSMIKFAPWEIAHTGVWHVTGQPFLSPPSTLSICAWAASTLLGFWWVACLFVGNGRTPYDWIAGTQVIHSPTQKTSS